MAKYIQAPKSKATQKRLIEIRVKLKEIFAKDKINLLDISRARILTHEYKQLINWDEQIKTRLCTHKLK